MEAIIDSQGSEIKLLSGYLKGTLCIAYRSCYTGAFFLFRENFFPYFWPNKSKSYSSIIIVYSWPMKIKVGYKAGDVTMNLRGQGKGSFEYRRDVCYIVCKFMREKGYFEFVTVFKCKNF